MASTTRKTTARKPAARKSAPKSGAQTKTRATRTKVETSPVERAAYLQVGAALAVRDTLVEAISELRELGDRDGRQRSVGGRPDDSGAACRRRYSAGSTD